MFGELNPYRTLCITWDEVIPGFSIQIPAAWESAESLLEMQNSRSTPDLLNQNQQFNKDPKWFVCTLKFAKL